MAKMLLGFIDRNILKEVIIGSFKKIDPRYMIKNPVMFITLICTIFVTICFIVQIYKGNFSSFDLQISLWLWLTVIFANMAESLAEGRGKAQALSLKTKKASLMARRIRDNKEDQVPASSLMLSDIVICETNDIIPADGEVIEGIASIDESAITGESAPVIRESGGDKTAVTAGTKVLSDRIIIKITSEYGKTFLDRIISLIEGSIRQKTPNEIALTIILAALSIILLLAVASIKCFADYISITSKDNLDSTLTISILSSLLVCLIPTTISALLNAIGISGMDRLIRKNVIAKSGRAIEAAGDVDILMIDKTGTITLGNRMAKAFIPAPGYEEKELAQIAQLASLSDETPEGRSIVILAKEKFKLRAQSLQPHQAKFIPFSAETKMSGVDLLADGKTISSIRKGSVEAVLSIIKEHHHTMPENLSLHIKNICIEGGTPLLVIKDFAIIGVIHLKDIIKGGIRERFSYLRKMGIKTVMITGDNPMTAAAIAAEAGIDDFIAQATPEDKLIRIRQEQKNGRMVAMTGDGTNDAPALAQADIGIAMNTGTQAAREAGNMLDLDSNPTKIIDIVETGKQLLITRGALTTFSIANDVAKYFAILPAIFTSLFFNKDSGSGPLSIINIMNLSSPKSAILSAVIFNALIIVILIPLALRGVKYDALEPANILRNNIIIYGFGGLVTPFIGIKLIDIIIDKLRISW